MPDDSKSKRRWFLIRVVVTISVIGFLCWKMRTELAEFGHTVAEANFAWIASAYLVYIVVLLCSVFRWQLLLRAQGLIVKAAHLIEYFMVGLFFNNFMLGATGGDVVKAYYVAKETHHQKTEAVTTVFIDRIVGMFGLITIALLALLFHLNDPRLRVVAIPIFGVFALFVFSILVLSNKGLVQKIPLFDTVVSRLPFRETIRRVANAFYVYHDHKGALVGAFVYSLGLQLSVIFIVSGLGRALGVQGVELVHYMLFVPLVFTVSSLPISFGGLGLGEGAFVYFFNLVTEQTAKYLALALTMRFLTIFWGLVGGVFLLLPKTRIPQAQLREEVSTV